MFRQLKTLFFLPAIFCSGLLSYGQQEVINLSTGVNNITGALMPLGQDDDTWTVTKSTNTTTYTPKTCTLSQWKNNTCARWISPQLDELGRPSMISGAGIYTYKTTFRINSRAFDCARLEIKSMGADNRITQLSINGYPYSSLTVPPGNVHYDPLIGPSTLTINPAHLNPSGQNTITFTVSNSETYTGFNLCANLEIGPKNILPALTGPSSFCPGDAFSFTASLNPGSGPTTHYLWVLEESTAGGTPVSGGFFWELWHMGTPGAFTFPSTLNPPCNKYYRVRLAAVNDNLSGTCLGWSEVSKVIYYSCKPTVNAGPDKILCESTYGFVGTLFPPTGMTYAWTIGNGPVQGTTSGMFINPSVTTTYTLTGTNAYGCSASDQVTVTVRPNNPDFNISTSMNTNYYTITATPVVLNANTQAGFGDYWSIEELNSAGVSLFSVNNPTQWWNYPSANTFAGFDHTTTNYVNPVNITSTIPANGRFLYNRRYRISRGTWNNNCEWNSVAYKIEVEKTGLGQPVVHITEDIAPQQAATSKSATLRNPENMADADAIRIYPNPSTGLLNINLVQDIEAQIDVFDLSGRKIQSRIVTTGTGTVQMDLSGYAKGIYMVHIHTGKGTAIHKVILQ